MRKTWTKLLVKLNREYGQRRLNMNISKIEYLQIGNFQKDPVLEIGGTKSCKEYKYIGSTIFIERTTKRDTENRTQQRKSGKTNILNYLLWSKGTIENTKGL